MNNNTYTNYYNNLLELRLNEYLKRIKERNTLYLHKIDNTYKHDLSFKNNPNSVKPVVFDNNFKKKDKSDLSIEKAKYDFKNEITMNPFYINDDLLNIEDLINLSKKYEKEPIYLNCNINLKMLHDLCPILEELNNMIGMPKIKNHLFERIILHLQGLNNKSKDLMHTVIYGSPGMGKTQLAKIIGKLYTKLGILSKGKFKQVSLTDLKAEYIGQSEAKTQQLLEQSKGCVLFFDEAYSLGSDDKLDSFSQSIIDVLNPFLDKYREDFILIIAGYKDDLDNRFF